jgi:hypothetical protein
MIIRKSNFTTETIDFFETLERELKQDSQSCPFSHEPNEITKKAIENVKKRKGLKSVSSVEELFKKLS